MWTISTDEALRIAREAVEDQDPRHMIYHVDPAVRAGRQFWKVTGASVIAGGVSPVRELARMADADASELGGRVANAFLKVWDSPQAQGAFASVLQMATSPDEGASPIREFVVAEILARVPKQCDDPVEADRRAQMMASQLLGIAVARYVLKLPMIAEATQQQLVDWAGPSLQCCIEGCDIPIAGRGRPALLDGESFA